MNKKIKRDLRCCDDCQYAYHDNDGMTVYCIIHGCFLLTNGYCDNWSEKETATLQEEFEALRAAIRKFSKPIMDKLEIEKWVKRVNRWIGGNR